MLLIALAIGFVSCEQTELSDRKYQNKLEGEWNLTLINGTLSKDGAILQEVSKTLPDVESYQSIKFNFKKDGTYEINAVFASDGKSECEMGKYSVVDGKLALYEPDDPDEPVYIDIVEISNKNLILKASESSTGGMSATFELHFEKL
jgi:hypothetical protein